jgi:hypothetical protein
MHRYSEHSVEALIVREFVRQITTCEDSAIYLEDLQMLIEEARVRLIVHGRTPVQQHNFFVQLKNDLTELTKCHPVGQQIINLISLETECN